MHARGERATSQIGWMLLGGVPVACVTAFAWTLAFSNTQSSIIFTAFSLVYLIPMAAVLTTLAWAGYLLGSVVARHFEAGEPAGLVAAAVGALGVGALVLVGVGIALGSGLGAFFVSTLVASLLAAVIAVTLARLPLSRPGSRARASARPGGRTG